MCTEPLYALRLKDEFDDKFKRFKKHSPIKVIGAVRDYGKDLSKLSYDKNYYDLIVLSCGQCLQCRLLKAKQRAVMSIAECSLHDASCFLTLTFGYPQTYRYYRHNKKLSHYLSSKKAHFHEWSLDTETFQKFMKRLRQWYYCYQLCIHLISINRSDLVPKSYPYCSHVRLPLFEKDTLLKGFNPNTIRFMHAGEYGDKKHRAHHHCICYGFDFPDKKVLYEDGKKYYTSDILSYLWPFGIHRIGDCTYQSSNYVARYVTKKISGNNQDLYYNGRKPEYCSYSTKPSLGFNYFKKHYNEFISNNSFYVVSDKEYTCSLPQSYLNYVKKIDFDLYNNYKIKRLDDFKLNFEKLLSQDRSIYSKLDSNKKIALSCLRKLVRSYEAGADDYDEYFKKAQAFGVSTKYFNSDFSDLCKSFLDKCNFKSHKSRNSNDKLHKLYYEFELKRNRLINKAFNVFHSDKRVVRDLVFYKNMPNPFKVSTRGRFLPDIESIDIDYGIE